jgi:ketosteroid isomerase-like protein
LPAREVIDLLIHQTTDPEVVVAEFTYRWRSQEPLSVGCVVVVRVRDGKIVESRDYIDPVARLVASSGLLRRILMRRSETWV